MDYMYWNGMEDITQMKDGIYGEIGSYGMVDVFYPDQPLEGSVWVEDFWKVNLEPLMKYVITVDLLSC